nr:serine/threonine-protein kinase [Pseudenhygromyxa sp. WMMC2535]
MARGGMGELFLAAAGETGGFEKLCVVKKVLTDLEDDGVRRRFLDEAKVVVRLNHANLVQVFDAGRVSDDYYLAMELVEGKDLRAVWNRCAQLHRRIPVDFAVFVIRELCRGLDYVHDAMSLDLVHRDISPPNIMVSYHGQIKITDFGLATHAIKRELTNPGVVFGRYSYLSPEQARGLPADRRTDIYASGIVLWEMLTGRQLFPADRSAAGPVALSKLRNPTIRAPSDVVPGIPEGLDEVVLAALAVEREDRFQTAGEFKVALTEVLNHHYSSCDVDSVAAFIREIFAREFKLEAQDYASYAREDFSPIRAQASVDESDSLSISDGVDVSGEGKRKASSRQASGQLVSGHDDTASIRLDDADVDELEPSDPRSWAEGPSTEELALAAQERVGTVIERYRIDRLLGVGGMGAVYAVTHLALGKTYALKVLHEIFSRDPDLIDRFMREARAATQTGHANIIDVVDIGTVQETGDVYFVMELLEGLDLGTVIRQSGPLAIRRTVHIARQICKALAAAHDANIIHRDLKSENVVLTVKGGDPDFVKVLDFGICKQVDAGSSSQTTPGLVMGSPDYMAPEQAAGASADVKSDIYALGTILFEMLTGRLPFVGRNAIDVLMKKGAADAPDVKALRPEVPSPLAEVVARCLSRDLDQRPASMKALEYELTRALEGRRSAVATIMGLQIDAEVEASASGSGPKLSGDPGGPGESSVEELPAKPSAKIVTVHDQAAAHESAAEAEVAGGKARTWPWVLLGAAAVIVLVLFLRPDLIPGLGGDDEGAPDGGPVRGADGGGEQGDAAVDEAGEELGVEGAARDEAARESAESGGEQGASEGEVAELGDSETTGALDLDPDAIVTRAEKALADEHWSEPATGSLAIELTNLAIVDPGHEAIARLRGAAQTVLEPRAKQAAKDEDWAAAVAAYRSLLAIWRDNEDSREALVDALLRLAKEQRQEADYEALLSTADELLNLEPKMFTALKLRADAFAGLERWEEAAPAYRAAMRQRPSNKDAKKGYWRARQEIKDAGKDAG